MEVTSEVPFFLQPPQTDPSDINIRLGKVEVDSVLTSSESAVSRWRCIPEQTIYQWSAVAECDLRGGREIVVQPAVTASLETIGYLLEGRVFGLLLLQRGHFLLHGSAVCVNENTAAFIGDADAGKSTIAAALCQRGHPLVTDDIIALPETRASSPFMVPGPQQSRLHVGSLSALGFSPDALQAVYPGAAKWYLPPPRVWVEARAPLHRIYVLALGDSLCVEQLEAQAAFLELVRCQYVRATPEMQRLNPREFHRAIAIAQRVPVFRLTRPHGLAHLQATAEFIEAHIASPLPCN